jgi:hypothetical protein
MKIYRQASFFRLAAVEIHNCAGVLYSDREKYWNQIP